MPSVLDNRYLEDAPRICPHAAKLINADTSQDQMSAKFKEESCHESKNGKSESLLENKEVPAAGQINWIPPNLPSRCTWRLGADVSESPHSIQAW